METMSKPEIRAYQDVLGVGDGSDDSGGNHELFPGLSEVDDVNSFLVAFVHVRIHQVGAVLSAEVHLYTRIRTPLGNVR